LWNAITESLEAPVAVPARLRPVILADARTAFLALWRNLAFWRVAGLGSAAAALVLGVGLAVFAARDARTPVLVAVLIKEGTNEPGAVVHAFANGQAELIPLESIDVPPDRALEIWTLWDRARGPVSIGLLDRARSVRLRLDQAPRTGPSQLFEITLEPKGGSPIGRPTGPILMKGTTAATL
jgi:anti-sigma-K factor RskA